ncbi:MAG: lipid-A-disaccharide synthase, partial [Cyanobium sp.]
PHISPINLVLQERLVPELLQDDLTAEAVAEAVGALLPDDSPSRARQLEGYGRLRKSLGEEGVTTRAAAAILDQVAGLD